MATAARSTSTPVVETPETPAVETPETPIMSDEIRTAFIAAQIDMAIKNPALWEAGSVFMPADYKAEILTGLGERKLALQTENLVKVAIKEDRRPENFDAIILDVVRALNEIDNAREVFTWKRTFQRGAGKLVYKTRVLKDIKVPHGEISIVHSEVIPGAVRKNSDTESDDIDE